MGVLCYCFGFFAVDFFWKLTIPRKEEAVSYWDRTDDYLGRHGGRGPLCPSCGEEMFAADDHGRFSCFCGGGTKEYAAAKKALDEERAKPLPQK